MSQATASSHHLLLDVDTGIDDALAIAFAVAHPAVEIRAITCVDGNTAVDQVVDNTLRLLDLLGAPDIPVASGANRPLIQPGLDAVHVHGGDGMGDLELPATRRVRAGRPAIDEARALLSDTDVPITWVSLAPMTNLALLLRADPAVASRIQRIVFMGGAIAGGNATAAAEYNIWHDPEAAHVVLNSGIPLTMYPLDVFNLVSASADAVGAFAEADTEIERVIAALLSFAERVQPGHRTEPFGLLGDAGVVCSLVDPGLVERRGYRVQVDTSGAMSRGQTYVDRRPRPGEDEVHNSRREWPWVDVIDRADRTSMSELFFSTVQRYASSRHRHEARA